MPRSRPDPDPRSAAVAIRTLSGRPDRPGRWLLVDERTGEVARTLSARGGEVHTWFRWAGSWGSASPSPPSGPFDQVVLRLPRSRDALRYAVERAAAELVVGGALWLAGCNDEGVKAAGKHLGPWFDEVETLDTKHHARLWWARRTQADARSELQAYLAPAELALPHGPARLIRAPGVFAQGGLDPGSRLLLRALADLAVRSPPTRVLDLGCGIGVLTAGVRGRWPGVPCVGIDHDAVALACFAEGLKEPGVIGIVGDGPEPAAEHGPFDLVVSNPPLHGTGTALSERWLQAWASACSACTTASGRLLFVVQRQRPILRTLSDHFRDVEVLVDDGRFRVWHAQHPSRA